MGLHKPFARHMFTNKGNVRKTGSAKNLGKGQLAIVRKTNPTANGLAVIGDTFANVSANDVLEIRLGKHKIADALNYNSKDYSSEPFKLHQVKSIKVNFPRFDEQKFDEWIIGYDGINANSALFIEEGQTSILNIALKGDALGLMGTQGCEHNAVFTIYRNEGESMQEVVHRLYNQIKEYTLPGGVPVEEILQVKLVDSEAQALTGDEWVFSYLNLPNEGTSTDLGDVQAQYEYEIQIDDRESGNSQYVMLHPETYSPAAYVQSEGGFIKGCENCPSGYVTNTGGFVYSVSLEDDGDDEKATVQALPNAVASSAVKKGQKDGKGSYVVLLTAKLTEAQILAFVGTNATAEVAYIGEVEDVCDSSGTTTTAWVEGDSCFATTQEYRIQLKNDECSGSRLAELQAAYPGATIAEVGIDGEGACQATYSMEVVTNILCEDCDPVFTELFTSEAPQAFEFIEWTLVEPEYDEEALMGIHLKGKPVIVKPTDIVRDMIPYYETSVRISVAGGYPFEINESTNVNKEPFEVKLLSRAQDRDNLGYHFLGWEDASKAYFDGTVRHKKNLYARTMLGEESVLDFDKQYATFEIEVYDNKYSQGVGRTSDMGTSYIIVAEVGRHSAVQDLVQGLAAKVGIPVEVALP